MNRFLVKIVLSACRISNSGDKFVTESYQYFMELAWTTFDSPSTSIWPVGSLKMLRWIRTSFLIMNSLKPAKTQHL